MSEGWSESELAAQIGRTPSWVSERLNELRQELLLQAGFLGMRDAEREALEGSIITFGIQTPILVDENLEIIDGRHRAFFAAKHGLDIPYVIADTLSVDEKVELWITLNASRRQLDNQQRRKLVEFELMRNPNRTDPYIGNLCGVHQNTVRTVRKSIEEDERRALGIELDETTKITTVNASGETHTETKAVETPTRQLQNLEGMESQDGRRVKPAGASEPQPDPNRITRAHRIRCPHCQNELMHLTYQSGAHEAIKA